MIQSSSVLEIATPLWLILLITSLRVSTTTSPLFFFSLNPNQKGGLSAIRFFVIIKVSRSGNYSPVVQDVQWKTRWTGVNLNKPWWLYVYDSVGEEQDSVDLQSSVLPALELSPNESQQSPQSWAFAPRSVPISHLTQLLFNHNMTPSLLPHSSSGSIQPESAADPHFIPNLLQLPQIHLWPISQLPCPTFDQAQSACMEWRCTEGLFWSVTQLCAELLNCNWIVLNTGLNGLNGTPSLTGPLWSLYISSSECSRSCVAPQDLLLNQHEPTEEQR